MTDEQERRVQASREAWAWMDEDRRSRGTAAHWFVAAMLGIATGAVVIVLAGLR